VVLCAASCTALLVSTAAPSPDLVPVRAQGSTGGSGSGHHPRRRMGETGAVTNAVTAGRLAGTSPSTPATPRPVWLRPAALGVALLALAVLAATWSGTGPRVLLGVLGAGALVHGVTALRAARTGRVDRAAAVSGAGAAWLGAAAIALALVSAAATGWVFVVAAVLALPALAALSAVRRTAAVTGAVVVAVAAVVLGVLGGVDALLDAGRVVAVAVVALSGVAHLVAAARAARVAAAPAPAAGCGGCACSAGGGGCGAAALR
jgi:hypothetical protein